MSWILKKNQLDKKELLVQESLYTLSNGYLGVRGNFEEGYKDGEKSIRGTYINAFHDNVKITHSEKLYAFPETQQKMMNNIDSQTVEILLGEKGETEKFSLFEGEILSFERNLKMDDGYSERIIHWRSPKGKELKFHFRRVVSFVHRELFAIEIKIEPINYYGKIKLISTVNGDVSNYIDDNDPRVSSSHSKQLTTMESKNVEDYNIVVGQTLHSKLNVACVTKHALDCVHNKSIKVFSNTVETHVSIDLQEKVTFSKFNVYTDSLRCEGDLIEGAIKLHKQIENKSVQDIINTQREYLTDYWSCADVEIDGDQELQLGMRFNLFHLLQSTGRDKFSNITAKGLSGEGYEGHYFWDTEIYMIPVFLMINPAIAKDLLKFRYYTLDQARERAKEMGHTKGALFPWRTITGTECCGYLPGWCQYHISADIAYSNIQYYIATKDEQFLEEFSAEILFETARLWMEIGHFHNGKFKINSVAGPNEYTIFVDNNYFTNVMAKHNLKWAAKVFRKLLDKNSSFFKELCERINISEDEVQQWLSASKSMYLPYSEELNINPQDDSFLKKKVWDFEGTPKENYPLLLHYNPLTLNRYQVCKQADTILAHFLLEDEQSYETMKSSYDYYEKITTHDSSLSYCIFSIMASKLRYEEKAYSYFKETVRLDLDNTHGNTRDGLHLANMAATWLAIVNGFGGLRLKEKGLYLNPSIPVHWKSYKFTFQYLGKLVSVKVKSDSFSLELMKGEEVTIMVNDTPVHLKKNKIVRFDKTKDESE